MKTNGNDPITLGKFIKEVRNEVTSDGVIVGQKYTWLECNGLSKLEYYAGLAMQGLWANPDACSFSASSSKTIAALALKSAKALIIELNKETNNE